MPVEVKGALELRKALRQFEPDLAKETSKELAQALKPIVSKARGFLPANEDVPSGWLKRPNAHGKWANRYYDQAEAKRGITYKTTPSKPNNKGFRALASILNKSTGGAIYETAGRKTSGHQGASTNPNAGSTFITGLGGSSNLYNAEEYAGRGRHSKKMRGRAMFRAVLEDQGKAKVAVIKAIEHAEAKFNGRAK
jgi:hypothetical protein